MAEKCVVICSGGLDSTTAAAHAKIVDGYDAILLHFRYRCRAETSEERAVRCVAEVLNARPMFWILNG
jgi:7-cyano-7-deazaguanine synthase in queuosine biosynthesis